MPRVITILISKIIMTANRLTGSSGSALPGLVAEKLNPDMLSSMARQFEKGVILVTGTNGKTTVVKIIACLLEASGYKVFTNKTGSNFTRGILSSLIDASTISGRVDADIAVIEVDEAYSRIIAKDIHPVAITVTNIMRDQLDRYGEIDKTAALIKESLAFTEAAILNADDKPVRQLAEDLGTSGTVAFFGVSPSLKRQLPSDDELLDPDAQSSSDSSVSKDIILEGFSPPKIRLKLEDKPYNLKTKLEGIHNAVNIVAGIATTWHVLGESFDIEKAAHELSKLEPAFGRGEKIELQDRSVHIALAKNPGGFNQNIRTFINDSTRVVLILINDNYADSRDVSWLWDVNFDALKEIAPTIIVGGNRAYDMALRLQYADIKVDDVDTDIRGALEKALSAGESTDDVVVFPTYTAMLQLRKVLHRYSAKVEDIW